MDLKTLAAVAFVVVMTLAGAVTGRLIWHHTHLDLMKEGNPRYSFQANWTITVIVFVALTWVGTKLKFFAAAGDLTKALAACFMFLAMVIFGVRPKWFWKW